MTLYYLNASRAECRRVLRRLERDLRIPRNDESSGVGHTSRWDAPRQTIGGLWGFKLKAFAYTLLSPADQASVQDLATLPGWQTEERRQPVVVRARFQHNALPTLAGSTTLYDGTGSAHDLGTQYTRADGLTWVVQPIVTLAAGARYVLALWVKIRGAASDEKALLDAVTLALESQNDTTRTLECRNRDGVWVLKNGLTASDGPIATNWPAGWRLYVPGDADGAPSGDACVLGQVV